ncbi:MAG TPA: response regulator transcription factor [Candidatus Sulfotelmatobacter sp.]|nr:response regulator transcription factor [Candidatus Sulfotelmatobacter sp.]HWI58723.1 response regulator transcription factor [Bacillota bacterium]
MSKKIGILIVDDHSLMRIGLATSINVEPDMAVIAEAGSGQQALERYRRHKPDIVLMDLRLPDLGGDEATAQLCKEFPGAKVIMLSTFEGHDDIFRCVQAGARSYLSKSVPLEELLRAIRAVYAGQNYLPPDIAVRLVDRMHSPELSAREHEVLKLIVKGLTNKEIANTLCIAETTVKDHVSKILVKLRASDRTQASTIAIQRGIVHLD